MKIKTGFAVFVLAVASMFPSFAGTPSRAGVGRPIRIGICHPLDTFENELSSVGLVGALVKFDLVNDAGGVLGRPIEPVVVRPKANREAIRDSILELVDEHGVGAVLVMSSVTLANGVQRAVESLEPEKRPLCVFPMSIDASIERLSPNFIRILPDSGFQADVLAGYLRSRDFGRLAIIYDNRFPVLGAMSQTLAVQFRAGGGNIVSSQPYSFGVSSGDEDFTDILDEVNARAPDVIAVLGYPEEIARLVFQSGSMNMKTRFCGGASWNSEVVFTGSGQNLDGCFFLGSFLPEDENPVVETFVSAVQATGVDYPGNEMAASYDAVGLIACLMEKSGAADGPALLEEFHRSASDCAMVTGAMFPRPNSRRFTKDINIYEIVVDDLTPRRILRRRVDAGEWLRDKGAQAKYYLDDDD